MTSQTRRSKRTIYSMEPESLSPTRTSQRKKKSTYKALQSTLPFALSAPSQLSQVSTSRRRSLTLSTRESSVSPTPSGPSLASSTSAPSTCLSKSKANTIRAVRRVFFEVDFDLIGREYSVRVRTHRSILQSRILWIYLHGIELEKGRARYWLCKHCHDVGKSKVLSAISTAGCSRHLNIHSIYPPGTLPPSVSNTTFDACLEGVHPLQAERWREDFINWVVHDNISFEQAASPLLRKVILGGGPSV
jgi:hypothetical protein